MVKHYKILIVLMLIFIFSVKMIAQTPWEVPADQAKITSSVAFDANAVKAGEDVYLKNCKSCHGDPGKNNVLPGLNPPPVDFTSEKFQKNSDGELFYKISSGRGTMPQFKAILNDEQRWQVIAYARSFNPNYTPNDVSSSNTMKGNFIINASLDEKNEKIVVFAQMKNDDGSLQALPNATVKFFVKRYFGNLQIGYAFTNDNGYATLAFPKDLPGDTNGCCNLIIKINNAEIVMEKAKICNPFIPADIYAKRVMWSWNAHTQWWIILTYLGVVSGVWIAILYVVMLIYKISKAKKIA